MLVDFVTVIAQTPSLAVVTYRPEYEGALTRMHGTQTIALGPLSDPETAALVSELLGPDTSVVGLGQRIADRAAGNPFFAEEMVRELAERGVLEGHRGGYTCGTDMAEVSVPATRAGGHRGAHRPPRTRCQADVPRRGGDRIALHTRAAHRAGR